LEQLQLQIARKVLPVLPTELRGWSMSGGSLVIALESVSEKGLLIARMSSFECSDGMHLVIPINREEGGGYDIVCVVAARFFRTGLDVTAELSVIRVERRKPFRSEPRATLNELCLIRLVSRRGGMLDCEGKVVDVSGSGLGIATDRQLEPGDRLEVASQIGPDALRCTLIVLYTDRGSFGRFRSGCRIQSTNAAGERLIGRHVETHGSLGGDPSLRRRSHRVA
jgi:hypothetical protein